MIEPAPLAGLWCATLTPLAPSGAIDHDRLAAHVHDLIGRGVDGIVLFGTTGEGPSFSVSERTTALDELLAAGVPATRLAVGTGCPALPDTAALVRHALASGCPRCLVLPPYFWKGVADDGLFAWYSALIEAVCNPALRLYLYHIPQLSAVAVSPELLARLDATYPGVVAGVKDSGGDFAHTLALIEAAPDLQILTGDEQHLPDLMRVGGAGAICGAANLFPELLAALLTPGADAGSLIRIRAFCRIIAAYPFVAAMKAVVASLYGDRVWRSVRPPLSPLPEPDATALLAELRSAGLLDER